MLSEFIKSLPLKLDTKVGERGVKLSGGERQRIIIARALYKKASTLIFDEATSALDKDTELNLINSLNGLNKNLTFLLITHRPEILSLCNKVYKLEKGNLTQVR